MSHFDGIVEGGVLVFDEGVKHEIMVVFVPIFDEREVTLCRAMEDKLGWFRD